jgi:Fusaric acid resistance protein-like
LDGVWRWNFYLRNRPLAVALDSAYRFAAITLSIVLLIAHQSPPWIVASHRFVEVSLGIAVALPGTKAG